MPSQSEALYIHRHAFDTREAVEQAFAQRRVRVVGKHHGLNSSFELHRGDTLGNDFSRLRADDVDAQDLAILRIGDDLDEAVVRIEDGGLRVSDERELAHLHL